MFVPANAVFKKEKENITNIRQLVYIRDIKKSLYYKLQTRYKTVRWQREERNPKLRLRPGALTTRYCDVTGRTP